MKWVKQWWCNAAIESAQPWIQAGRVMLVPPFGGEGCGGGGRGARAVRWSSQRSGAAKRREKGMYDTPKRRRQSRADNTRLCRWGHSGIVCHAQWATAFALARGSKRMPCGPDPQP